MTQTVQTSNKGWQYLDLCPLCGSSNHKTLYEKVKDRHYKINGEFTIEKCNECSLVFLNPMPDDSVLVNLYPEDFYSYQEFIGKSNQIKEFLKKFLLPGTGTKDPIFDTPGKILDIGCGSGQFLSKMRDQGWQTYGVEVSNDAATLGKTSAGLDIFAGSLLEANFPSNNFDYIRSNHSFEHIYNPNETMEEIHRILKPGGKLLIGVPNINSLNADLFKQYWWYLGAPVHTFNYSVKSLTEMLEKHEFLVEKVTFNSDYSGILGSFQIYLNRNSQKTSADGLVIKNTVLIILSQYLSKLVDLFKSGDVIEVTCTKR
jgi:SAM-dependent methyltransferase